MILCALSFLRSSLKLSNRWSTSMRMWKSSCGPTSKRQGKLMYHFIMVSVFSRNSACACCMVLVCVLVPGWRSWSRWLYYRRHHMSCSTAGLRVSAQHTTVTFCAHNRMTPWQGWMEENWFCVNYLSLFIVHIWLQLWLLTCLREVSSSNIFWHSVDKTV